MIVQHGDMLIRPGDVPAVVSQSSCLDELLKLSKTAPKNDHLEETAEQPHPEKSDYCV